MTSFKSPFLQELSERGFLHQCTHLEELDLKASKESIILYGGFDATAPSLHVGNLMLVMMFRIAQRHGHKPIVLMGGGTTKIGDPSGKDKARPLITDNQIESNIQSIQQCFSRYIVFGKNVSEAILVNNNDWLSPINYLDFLRVYGCHFSINRMLSFDSVKLRLEREQPLTFLEFNYMILQSYDFLELYRRHHCVVQLGGSDQWGNILNGVELIRRIEGGDAFGLTSPLITTSSGKKMGKSEQGAIWLNREALSPFDYWQYWRNTEDADVIRFLKFYTDLSVNQINDLSKTEDINALKIRLADEATSLAHGVEVLPEIHRSIAQVFGGDDMSIEVIGTDEKGNACLQSALPIIQLPHSDLEKGIPAFMLLAHSGLAESNGEARRLIRGNGCKINDMVVEDENKFFFVSDLQDHNILKVSAGKKRHVLIQGVL
ncbi:MAG: tyrosine--tRNA ligase [Alphaproteobacteria bacterium]|nr:tyrosine--tRNA ligase [Alphaproteobacteria bacterium]